ncbi:MAG TPA: choice-of-anchor tandem repeat GloVer-containing protein [Rhizomicrobium sp.]|nr:choice-of-anchor tandem repeat GloVer-containing protein [Rhizomicrobium sp.]
MKPNVMLRFASAVAACAMFLYATAAPAASYKVLYNFGLTRDDGVLPNGLINIKNTLYGTALQGGVSTRCNNKAEPGCGTVFSITTDGVYKTLHSFKGGTDGIGPSSGNLIDVNGTLYGTTVAGGTGSCPYDGDGCGTIFSITTKGRERVVYSFKDNDDGYEPNSLINVNGTSYGTTLLGGTGNCTIYAGLTGCGTMFSIAPDGTKTILYNFTGGGHGAGPSGGLIYVNGKLYGTTVFGGTGSCTYDGAKGCGTVFSVTPDGKEKVLYSFRGGRDGAEPAGAGLVDVKGKFFGTTSGGGGQWGGGTVFSLSMDGHEQVLHKFGYGRHGGVPEASLLDVNGTLFGTAEYGGAKYRSGVIFSITRTGTENVVHQFTSTDGMFPQAQMIDINGTIYGTTEQGGRTFLLGGCLGDGGNGCGVVFSVKP